MNLQKLNLSFIIRVDMYHLRRKLYKLLLNSLLLAPLCVSMSSVYPLVLS